MKKKSTSPAHPAKEKVPPKTAAQRTARVKERLKKDGGKRISLNLEGVHTKKLDELKNSDEFKKQKITNHSAIIRKLILDR